MTDNKDKNENLNNAKLVEVAKRPSEGEAAVVVAVLADEGIKAVAVGGFTAGFIAEAPGWVSVQTFEADAERAKNILAEIKANPQEWPGEDVR